MKKRRKGFLKNVVIDKKSRIDPMCCFEGVNLVENSHICKGSFIENSKIINCVIGEGVKVEDACLKNCYIKKNCVILRSEVEGCEAGEGVFVGPFARIRPECVLGDGVKIGNFVEIKNSKLGDRTKVNHLAYVGDAEIGEGCNIGAGVVFVNYDGKKKHKTFVGSGCFIGSNSNLIAPLKIADKTFIACGTTVTEDSKQYDFIIGRSRAEIKPGMAERYLKK